MRLLIAPLLTTFVATLPAGTATAQVALKCAGIDEKEYYSRPGVVPCRTIRRLLARYPVRKYFRGRPAQVNLRSHPDARMYRTALRHAAKFRPDFAGHMNVAIWGCGTGCKSGAAIDARTGKVTWLPVTGGLYIFRRNSRLLIANPSTALLGVTVNPMGPYYTKSKFFLWSKGRFKKIRIKWRH